MNLRVALSELNPGDDDHWTAQGLPLIEKLKELTGDDTLNRKIITEQFPTFVRGVTLPNEDEVENAEQAQESEEVKEEKVPEVGDPVWLMGLRRILADRELCERAVKECDRRLQLALDERKNLNDRIAELSHNSDYLGRQLQRLTPYKPDAQQEPIKAYLAAQKQNRDKKIERAMELVDEGVKQKDLKAVMKSQAPIDASYASRRKTPRLPAMMSNGTDS